MPPSSGVVRRSALKPSVDVMPTAKKTPAQTFHVPGLTAKDSGIVVTALQDRLFAYTDLHLVLKHVHWNVVGAHFIGVHQMLDPQVDARPRLRRRARRAHRDDRW